MKTNTVSKKYGRVQTIELGGDWVKFSIAHHTRRGVEIEYLKLIKVESALNLLSAVQSAVRDVRLKSSEVIACIPRRLASIRILELPSTNPSEIQDMVELQIGKQTPYSRDEIVFDSKILGEVRLGYTRVMLVIVQRGLLSECFGALEDTGFVLEGMTVSTEGVAKYWASLANSHKTGGKTVGVIDIDSSFSDVAVISPDNELLFTRSIMMGANTLLTAEPSELEKFAREVSHSIEMCAEETSGVRPERLVILGAGTQIGRLCEAIKNTAGIPCEMDMSFQELIKLPQSYLTEKTKFSTVSLTAISGFSMVHSPRWFNLIPDSVLIRKKLIRKAHQISNFATMGVTALVSLSLLVSTKLQFKIVEFEALKDTIAKLQPQARMVAEQREIVNLVRKRTNRKFTPANILAVLHPLIPDGIVIETIEMNMEQQPGMVRLTGTAPGAPAVISFVEQLRTAPVFKDASTEGAVTADVTGRAKFRVVCILGEKK
jgi:Tfp pilus assembly PilM family ATPase